MNEHILIIEDEEELCVTLGDRLRSEGYVVDIAFDGRSGMEKAVKLPFDLIILDIMLPFRNGFDLCSDIRREGLVTPILLLTARSQTAEKVVGLKLGADDYVTKPFDTFELMARIEALLRRVPSKSEAAPAADVATYHFGSIVLDVRKATVTRSGEPVNLTAREFYLLRYFAEHQGIALTRDELLRDVWGHKADTFTRTVDMHVASLRQKLESSPKKPELIVTVPGIGYRFSG
jgi:two-component system, OmpR family, alkaline phosphatase synthesis response regulator PhoP